MSGKIKKKLPVILVCISMFVVFSGIILTLMCTTGLTEIPALYNVRKEETANKENKAVGDNGEALVSASATEGNDVADEDGEKDNNILAGYCTFYDYVVAPYRGAKYKPGFKELASQSINTASNYANDGRDKLTVGTKNQNYKKNRYSCNVNGLDVNTCIYYNDGKYKTTGTFDGKKKEYYNASQGIIKGLDKEDYRRVIFNVDEPGLFSDEAKTEISSTVKYFQAHGAKDVNIDSCEAISESKNYTYVYIRYNLVLQNDQEYPCISTYLVKVQDKKYYLYSPAEISDEISQQAAADYQKFMTTKTYTDYTKAYEVFLKKNPGYEDKIAGKLNG